MAYTATLAARLSQFGVTELEWNLTDSAGRMADVRLTRKLRTEKPTPEEIASVLSDACAQLETDWLKAQPGDPYHTFDPTL